MKTITAMSLLLALACIPAGSKTIGSPYGQFSAAGLEAEEVERFFLAFKAAIAKDDKPAVAAMASYPIKVTLAKGRRVTLRSRAAFIKQYDAIFDSAFKQLIAATRLEDLWAKWSGVATPRGEIWINGIINNPKKPEQHEIKIITINGVVDRKR